MAKVTPITVAEASELTGLSQQAIRCGIKANKLPFGFAFRSDGAKAYAYRIIKEHLLLWMEGKL